MNTKDTKSLWNYVPLKDYSRPTEATSEAVRMGLRSLWDRLREFRMGKEDDVEHEQLIPAPDELKERVAPTIQWDDAVKALSEALSPWLESETHNPSVQALIGPPGSGSSRVAISWAEANEWQIVSAPTPDEILSGGKDWLKTLTESENSRLVIPRLENFYLRHYNGIDMLERLLDWLWSSECPCLIECDSWSWAYLSKTIQIDSAIANPYVLDGFDSERLQLWFQSLCDVSGSKTAFRQIDNGRPVLPLHGVDITAQEDESLIPTTFMMHVAAYSRGIPDVAHSVWRHSLHVRKPEDSEGDNSEQARQDSETLWVPAWAEVNLPTMPGNVGQNELFVLQEILLDGSMSAQLLAELLPISFSEVTHSLQRLHSTGLLEWQNGVWEISLLGYPAIRQHMHGAGYLVDAF